VTFFLFLDFLRLWLHLIGFQAFASLSIRTPYERPNPFDYEIRYGWETKTSYFMNLFERENGKFYKGHEYKLRVFMIKYRDFLKEAVGIDQQNLDITVPVYLSLDDLKPKLEFLISKDYDIRVETGYRRSWKAHKEAQNHIALSTKKEIQNLVFNLSYARGKQSILSLLILYNFEYGKIRLRPKLRYERFREKSFMQFKTEVWYKFNL